jgi:hypothetical protein
MKRAATATVVLVADELPLPSADFDRRRRIHQLRESLVHAGGRRGRAETLKHQP